MEYERNICVDDLLARRLLPSPFQLSLDKSVYEKWQWNHASSNKLSCYNGRSVQLERSPVKDEDERNKEDDSIRKNKILPPLQAWDISIDE